MLCFGGVWRVLWWLVHGRRAWGGRRGKSALAGIVKSLPNPLLHTHTSPVFPLSAVLVQPCSSLSDTVSCNVCFDVSEDASLGERRNGLHYEGGASSRALLGGVVRLSGMGIEGSEAASQRIVNLLKEELSFISNLYTWWFNCSVDARG